MCQLQWYNFFSALWSTLLLSYVVPVKGKMEISQNCVAFSEYMNFKWKVVIVTEWMTSIAKTASVWPWVTPLKKNDWISWFGRGWLCPTIKVQMSIFCNSKRSEVNKQGCQNTISNHFTFLTIYFRLILNETNKKTRCKCDGLLLWWMSNCQVW